MATWHDANECSRFDLFKSDGLATCLNCGSTRVGKQVGEEDSEESGAESNMEYSDVGYSDVEDGGETPVLPAVASPTGQAYAYQPIKERTEMRLFILQPGEQDDPVCGELITISASAPYALYEYDAISYTWADETGDASRCRCVYIGADSSVGVRLPVTRNCQAVLQRIRNRYYTKYIWIDSICIDQDNIQERSHQVGLMPRIYTRARKTYVYVGEETENTKVLLESLAKGVSGEHEVAAQSLAHFLCRPFFFRVWVVQEIALSRNAIIVGKRELPWSVLRDSQLVKEWAGPKPLLSLGNRRLRNPDELIDLLHLGRYCETTDPRDKVFALLGLVAGAEAEGLVADYSKGVEEIYTWIARYLIDVHKRSAADILGILNILDWNEPRPYNLPSWVPDWSNPGRILLEVHSQFKKYLDEIPLAIDPNDPRALLLTGYLYGHLNPSIILSSNLSRIEWLVRHPAHRQYLDKSCGCPVCEEFLPLAVVFKAIRFVESTAHEYLILLLPHEHEGNGGKEEEREKEEEEQELLNHLESQDLDLSWPKQLPEVGAFKFVGLGRLLDANARLDLTGLMGNEKPVRVKIV